MTSSRVERESTPRGRLSAGRRRTRASGAPPQRHVVAGERERPGQRSDPAHGTRAGGLPARARGGVTAAAGSAARTAGRDRHRRRRRAGATQPPRGIRRANTSSQRSRRGPGVEPALARQVAGRRRTRPAPRPAARMRRRTPGRATSAAAPVARAGAGRRRPGRRRASTVTPPLGRLRATTTSVPATRDVRACGASISATGSAARGGRDRQEQDDRQRIEPAQPCGSPSRSTPVALP